MPRVKQIEPLLVRLMRETSERREMETFGSDGVPDDLDEPLARLVGDLLDQGMCAALHKSDTRMSMEWLNPFGRSGSGRAAVSRTD